MLRKELLEHAQTVVSAGLIGEGVEVVFDAVVPHADLKNRVMHLRPLPEEISEETLLHLRADCDHEMGHFGFTAPDALENPILVKRPLVKLVANAIEDGFIEKKVSDRWLGCAQNLAESNAKLRVDIRKRLDDGASTGEELTNALRALAINGLQMLVFGHPLAEVYSTFGDELAPLYVAVSDLLPKLSAVKSTSDSIKLAIEFVERWHWEHDDTKSPDAARSLPVVGDAGFDAKAQSDQTAPQSKADRERESLIATAIQPNLLGTLRKTFIADNKFADYHRYRSYTVNDVVEMLEPAKDPAEVHGFLESVRRIVPPLRRRLVMEFSGVGRRFEANQRRGEIDQRALHKVALGSDRVFRKKIPKIVIDADVTLLVDASGSMLGSVGRGALNKLHLAAQAACGFSMVLDHLGVSHEALAFTTAASYPSGLPVVSCLPTPGVPYERVTPLRHIVVKPAALRFRQRRGAFASLSSLVMCAQNCDGEAVLWAAQRLAARNREGMKPILIVFSDGLPASMPEDGKILRTHLKRTVKRIEDAGVTCIGIGIASDSVSKFYSTYTVINDVSDLIKTSYEVIRAALRKARRAS